MVLAHELCCLRSAGNGRRNLNLSSLSRRRSYSPYLLHARVPPAIAGSKSPRFAILFLALISRLRAPDRSSDRDDSRLVCEVGSGDLRRSELIGEVEGVSQLGTKGSAFVQGRRGELERGLVREGRKRSWESWELRSDGVSFPQSLLMAGAEDDVKKVEVADLQGSGSITHVENVEKGSLFSFLHACKDDEATKPKQHAPASSALKQESSTQSQHGAHPSYHGKPVVHEAESVKMTYDVEEDEAPSKLEQLKRKVHWNGR